ncbi:MAG TPA: galactokinase family protein [Roseimicrobium sp.]|nr:galactokinase family protein [Roseimicrobium sp.]
MSTHLTDLAAAKAFFRRHFGYTPPHVVRAPGRVEILGNHTDYNLGLMLSAAIDRYVYMAASPRSDGKIEIASSAFPDQKEKFWLSRLEKNPESPWTDYVKGVLQQLRKRKVHFSGFSATYHSTIPIGSGLGSSSAMTVATALMVRQLYPFQLTETGASGPPKRLRNDDLPPLPPKQRLYMAQLCRAAENEFVGVQSGLLDPVSSLLGKEFHVVQTDFMYQSVERLPFIGEIALVLCDSGVTPPRTEGGFRERRELCEAAARAMRAKSLRSIEPADLSGHKKALTRRQHDCAYHIVGENQRVVYGEKALREEDFVQFGQYLLQSHESSRDFFRNSTPELDLLVEIARDHPACLGARLTGGGFGGATINLVQWTHVDAFMKHMTLHYGRRTGRLLLPKRLKMVDGAEVL